MNRFINGRFVVTLALASHRRTKKAGKLPASIGWPCSGTNHKPLLPSEKQRAFRAESHSVWDLDEARVDPVFSDKLTLYNPTKI